MPDSSADDARGFVAALQAGLSPIPVDPTTKRPLVRWKPFQETAADLLQAQAWDRAGHGMALCTGGASGRLMCLDFEVGFMGRLGELSRRLADAGLSSTFDSWLAGYCESTPSGGMHVLVRVGGEGRCDGNTKLASDGDGKTLVETRGEGGYVIVASTPGWVLLSGGFETIAWATEEEWKLVSAAVASFDLSPAAVASFDLSPAAVVSSISTLATPSVLRLGGSWIADVLAALPPIETVLEEYGWQRTGTSDRYGEHWTRPGKTPREGSSASLSVNGRLYVHSSNAGLHVGNPTYDAADLLFFYEHGRDGGDRERVEWLQTRRDKELPVARHPGADRDAGATPNGGNETADTSVHLPDTFWEATPLLTAIREASMLRGLSPDGVFGAWLSAYAATIPMAIWVAGPPQPAPLNMYSCLVGTSGTSKSASMSLALDLLGWNVNTNRHVLLAQSLRSGEGLCRLAQIERKNDGGDPAYRNAVHVVYDEGGVLGKQADRQGATMIGYLNTAWSGTGTVGGALAREIIGFPAGLVRICAAIGVQYGAAGNLFEGEAARLGFPQRLLYFGMRHPDLAATDVDTWTSQPATPLNHPFWSHAEHSGRRTLIEFPADIEHDVRLWTQNKNHGNGIDDPYDGHQMNLTKRIAAILALAEGSTTPTHTAWDLATMVLETSKSVRRQLLTSLGDLGQQRTRARVQEAVMTADALDDRWLKRRAQRIARYIHGTTDGVTLKDIKARLNPSERPRRNEIVSYAIASDWVIHRDGRYFPGGTSGGTNL